jgi:hypothetical protein
LIIVRNIIIPTSVWVDADSQLKLQYQGEKKVATTIGIQVKTSTIGLIAWTFVQSKTFMKNKDIEQHNLHANLMVFF